MDWFLHLPSEYIKHILIPLLSLVEVARIDEAIVNHKARIHWLQLLHGSKPTIPPEISYVDSENIPAYKWLAARNICIQFLTIGGDATDESVQALSQMQSLFDSYTLDLYFYGMEVSFQILFEFLLQSCRILNLLMSHASDENMTVFMSRTNKGLHTLTMEQCAFETATFSAIPARFPDLVTISLFSCENASPAIADIIANLPKLRHFHLHQYTSDDVLIALSHKRELISVFINEEFDVDPISDAGLLALVEGCPFLEHVNFRECDAITDLSVQALANSCPRIKSFQFPYCRHLTDACLLSAADHCKGLLVLDMSNCALITDAGVSGIAQGCPLLQRYDLRGCRLLTDAAARAIAHSSAKVEVLNMALSDAALAVVMQKCAKLRDITTHRARAFVSSFIEALYERGPGCPWEKVLIVAPKPQQLPKGLVKADVAAELVKRRVYLYSIVDKAAVSHVTFPPDL